MKLKLKVKLRPKTRAKTKKLLGKCCFATLCQCTSLIPKLSPLLVVDHFQYASIEEDGTRKILSCVRWQVHKYYSLWMLWSPTLGLTVQERASKTLTDTSPMQLGLGMPTRVTCVTLDNFTKTTTNFSTSLLVLVYMSTSKLILNL